MVFILALCFFFNSGFGTIGAVAPNNVFEPLSAPQVPEYIYKVIKPEGCYEATDLIIYHTADHHGRFLGTKTLEGDEVGGFARMQAFLKQDREKTRTWSSNKSFCPAFLLLDAGDVMTGDIRTDISKNIYDFRAIDTLLNYDAMVVGNHDWDYGVRYLFDISSMVNFPVLGANVHLKNAESNPLPKYMIFEIGSIKLALIGLTTKAPKFSKYTKAKLRDIIITDANDSFELLYPEIMQKHNPNFIAVLSHLGNSNEDPEVYRKTSSHRLAELSDGKIDFIIDGHGHQVLNTPKVVESEEGKKTYIFSAGADSEYIGKVVFKIRKHMKSNDDVNKTLITPPSLNFAYTKNIRLHEKDYAKDPEFFAMEREIYQNSLLAEYLDVISEDSIALDGSPEKLVKGESNLAQLFADAIRIELNADLSAINSGSIRSSIAAGMVYLFDIIAASPFKNKVMVAELDSDDIKKITGVQEKFYRNSLNREIFYFSGLEKYKGRLYINGEKIRNDVKYKFVSTDYFINNVLYGLGVDIRSKSTELDIMNYVLVARYMRNHEYNLVYNTDGMCRQIY